MTVLKQWQSKRKLNDGRRKICGPAVFGVFRCLQAWHKFTWLDKAFQGVDVYQVRFCISSVNALNVNALKRYLFRILELNIKDAEHFA